jgi:hypothetical protein
MTTPSGSGRGFELPAQPEAQAEGIVFLDFDYSRRILAVS